jgi:hypothetical protein
LPHEIILARFVCADKSRAGERELRQGNRMERSFAFAGVCGFRPIQPLSAPFANNRD